MPRIEFEPKLDFRDVLLRPKRSTLRSRADVELAREFQFRNSKKSYSGIPVIASNMDTVGTFEMAVELAKSQLFTTIHKHYSVQEWKDFVGGVIVGDSDVLSYMAISAGTSDNDYKKVHTVCNEIPEIQYICLDVANGYSQHFVDFIRKVREEFPTHTIFAGNVVTGEMVEELILVGADVVKVGIGPGSVCTTRKKAGVGYPQLSAVLECADAAHGLKGHVISDGGCTNPGDVAKAFAAGADFVMLGGLFAGHDQSGGEVIVKGEKKFKQFYGMSSDTAMKKHHGSVAEYRASEGKTIEIPYRGDVNDTVKDLLGGIRSACTYTGAEKLKELAKRATFIRVNQQTNEIYTSMKSRTCLALRTATYIFFCLIDCYCVLQYVFYNYSGFSSIVTRNVYMQH
uniref:GMP reductase n=1 Tax=Ditylenchus dipsaci TaxID=166011 RepID=A0A915DFM8_9BILA